MKKSDKEYLLELADQLDKAYRQEHIDPGYGFIAITDDLAREISKRLREIAEREE
jgi:vacuolar-type H+-ATPase subunit F/Vma7